MTDHKFLANTIFFISGLQNAAISSVTPKKLNSPTASQGTVSQKYSWLFTCYCSQAYVS